MNGSDPIQDKSSWATLQGELERITYASEEDSYVVARLKVKGYRELVTVVGDLVGVTAGERLLLRGRWVQHPKFGGQFRVESYRSLAPATLSGIEKYLASGLIRGVGPVMARRLVGRFGLQTLEVIEHEPQRLREVGGIGEKRVGWIRRAWEEQREVREVMLFLQEQGVSASYAAKIYKTYGAQSLSAVRENPYRLAAEVHGIGFKTADKIAQSLGIDLRSPLRAEAGIIHVLNQLADEGHVYYPGGALIESCSKILEVEAEVLIGALEKAALERRVVVECLDCPGGGSLPGACPGEGKSGGMARAQPAVQLGWSDLPALHAGTGEKSTPAMGCSAAGPDGPEPSACMARGVYLAPFYTAETGIVLRLRALIQASSRLLRGQKIQVEKAVEWAQKRLGITLAEKQRQAVGGAISHKTLVITGGPGTGKTTIVRAILEIYQELGAQVLLAAPTGRAAKRLSEATGREACTIHRLLEYSPRQGGFQRDQQRRLEADVVVVDEASMIDTILMYHLLKAIPRGATFIVVGDVHQLPSVGPGSVLRDILQSGVVEVVELTEIFRQARESTIVLNAHRINQGQLPQLPPADKKQLADFYFITEETPPKVTERIVELCSRRIPSRFHLDPLNEIQVLTPMNRGEVGTQGLNQALQQALNPHGQEVTRLGRSLRLGDKVMQIRNNYDKEVYNGDIGRIVGIDMEEQELTVRHDVGEVTYDFSELDELILAYAISVHRAQGSEYPAIVMPLLTQHYPLLQRNLLYTAVTRARRLVVLIGSRRALAIAVKSDQVQKRYTWLAERLRRGWGGSVRPLDEELPAEDLWIGGQ